jgi:hypothetical protein
MNKFIDAYNNILTETILTHIKQQLLRYFNKTTWEEYIDSLEFGQCQKIAKIVYCCCPQLVKIYSGTEQFPQAVIEQLNALGDNNEMNGVHYIVNINDRFYDFGKGANTINNIYLIGTNKEKYNIEMTEAELNCFDKLIFRHPDSLYHIKVNQRKIKPLNI